MRLRVLDRDGNVVWVDIDENHPFGVFMSALNKYNGHDKADWMRLLVHMPVSEAMIGAISKKYDNVEPGNNLVKMFLKNKAPLGNLTEFINKMADDLLIEADKLYVEDYLTRIGVMYE